MLESIMPTFAAASFGTIALGILFFLVAAFMILVVLIQKPKGGGLAGAFGGGGGGGQQAMFGAKVGDVLTWVTVVIFALFLLLAVALVFTGRSDAVATPPNDEQVESNPADPGQTPAPAETPATE